MEGRPSDGRHATTPLAADNHRHTGPPRNPAPAGQRPRHDCHERRTRPRTRRHHAGPVPQLLLTISAPPARPRCRGLSAHRMRPVSPWPVTRHTGRKPDTNGSAAGKQPHSIATTSFLNKGYPTPTTHCPRGVPATCCLGTTSVNRHSHSCHVCRAAGILRRIGVRRRIESLENVTTHRGRSLRPTRNSYRAIRE